MSNKFFIDKESFITKIEEIRNFNFISMDDFDRGARYSCKAIVGILMKDSLSINVSNKILVDKGALRMVANIMRRMGKDEAIDALLETCEELEYNSFEEELDNEED